MKELLKQLTIFIIHIQYEDVRFDNIPLTQEGRIAIFDHDNDGDAITGLIKGTTADNKINGLFQMVPIRWFNDIIKVINTHLPSNRMPEFKPHIEGLRKKAEVRKQKRAAELAWFKSKGINKIENKITFNLPYPFESFQNNTNAFLQAQKNYYDLITGRKIHSSFSWAKPITNEYVELQRQIFNSEMQKLLQRGLIYKFKSFPAKDRYFRYSVLL